MIAVVTNIDADHMTTYGGDFARLRDTFIEFLHHLPFYGLAVLCSEDPVTRDLPTEISRPVKTYGFGSGVDVRATQIKIEPLRSHFRTEFADGTPALQVTLNMPGRHNILNALAAIAVARELGVDNAAIQRGLAGFQGIGRRFQMYGELPTPMGGVLLIDDYGHHPRELAAVFQTARESWPERRLVVAFQPHRYSRTRELFDDFVKVLSDVDALLLCEVYAAGEQPVGNDDGRSLCRGIRARAQVDPVFVERLDELPALLREVLQDGDVLLTVGAGSIGALAKKLPAQLTGAAA
jgi:UDP-N-acetylmuramate--alanine ligase